MLITDLQQCAVMLASLAFLGGEAIGFICIRSSEKLWNTSMSINYPLFRRRARPLPRPHRRPRLPRADPAGHPPGHHRRAADRVAEAGAGGLLAHSGHPGYPRPGRSAAGLKPPRLVLPQGRSQHDAAGLRGVKAVMERWADLDRAQIAVDVTGGLKPMSLGLEKAAHPAGPGDALYRE